MNKLNAYSKNVTSNGITRVFYQLYRKYVTSLRIYWKGDWLKNKNYYEFGRNACNSLNINVKIFLVSIAVGD
jgi:hypothetical protein